jgi:hypothetical protein
MSDKDYGNLIEQMRDFSLDELTDAFYDVVEETPSTGEALIHSDWDTTIILDREGLLRWIDLIEDKITEVPT